MLTGAPNKVRGKPVANKVRGKPVVRLARVAGSHSDYVCSVAWSPDGTKLASGSDDKTVRIWEAATGKQLCSLSSSLYAMGNLT